MIICETPEDVYHCLGGKYFNAAWWKTWTKVCAQDKKESPYEIHEGDLMNWGTLEMKMKYLKGHVPPKAIKLASERPRKIINAKVAV